MYSVIPSTFGKVVWRRLMISVAEAFRSSSGFRLIWIRPLLIVVFVPSIPMNEERLATAGSFRISFARACWRTAMAWNETDCGASEIPRMTPVSWTGKNPFGTTT